jgi:hypothetical protein
VHAAWGLGGWSLLLVAGVAYLVVPMFQLTPPYPAWLTRSFSVTLFFLLAAWSITWLPLQRPDGLQVALACAAALLAVVFAAVTLRLQAQRRRKVTEPTLLFWRLAMVCLVVAASAVMLQQLSPGERGLRRHALPARRAAHGGRVHAGDQRHALQDHALPQLDAFAEDRQAGPGGAEHAPDDPGAAHDDAVQAASGGAAPAAGGGAAAVGWCIRADWR